MRTHYVVPCKITVIEERERLVSSIKNDKGETETVTESTGWWAALDLGVAIGLGHEKPEGLAKGDAVELVLRPRAIAAGKI